MQQKRRIAIMMELRDPWQRHLEIFHGVQRYADEQDHWECLIDEFVPQTLSAHTSRDAPYDGVIARATIPLADGSKRLGIPVVNTWLHSPATQLPLVINDYKLCGRLCFEHLVERGFRRLAYLGLQGMRDQAMEIDVIDSLCDKNKLEFATLKLQRNYGRKPENWTRTHQQLDLWLSRLKPPVGLVISEEFLARIFIQIVKRRGLNVPQDIAVICGSNEVIMCESVSPRLTSVNAGLERIGYEAARLLDRLISGEPSPEETVLLPPAGIVARESTDYFAVEDGQVAEALQYISMHISEPIGVGDIAQAVSVAPRTLQRRFQQHLGCSVAAELRRLLSLAKRLLVDPEKTVKEIAFEAGFVETAVMRKVFHREFGISPSDYRKEYLAKNK